MIDSKKLIEVMPLLSGNQYKIFVYLIYGYQMAIETYHQPYYEISQNEIVKKTGIPRPTAQRAITELKEKGLVSYSTKQQGQTKTRARYVIPDYETYLVHFDAKNDKSYAQNDTYIKDNNDIDKQSSVLQSRPDLKGLYDTSIALGDALRSQTTIDGLNEIKERFIKLWDDASNLYVYDTKYREDKDKNWRTFLRRYNGAKSQINLQTAKQHTPKQVDKRDKREISEMGTPRPAASPRKRSEMEWDMQTFNPEYAVMPFSPTIFSEYMNGFIKYLKSGYYLDKDQLNRAVISIHEWIENSWVDGVDEVSAGADKDGEIMLSLNQWKIYAKNLICAYNTDPINPPRYTKSDDDVF